MNRTINQQNFIQIFLLYSTLLDSKNESFQSVLEHIMLSYDRKTVPIADGVDVKVDLILQAISSISEIAASFTADVLFSQIWLDPGLSFENMTRYVHP